MKKLIQLPGPAARASVSADAFTGKLWGIAQGTGGFMLAVGGGDNPGQYYFDPKVVGGIDPILTALTNKANVYGLLSNGKVTYFGVYAT